ncbi:unnamed protein product [Lactuca virosa]|uniref:MHD domain-containing protein n=1 Tax=Lactuca virosa TaxID=75947 RepID=A0AAU9NN49_9ASTR|nr:unnamed protein product [Lactuca virosa]
MTLSSTRTISFVPPDGAFDLMTYRLSTQVKHLIWVEAQIERHSRSRMEIMVKARSQFKEPTRLFKTTVTLIKPSPAVTSILMPPTTGRHPTLLLLRPPYPPPFCPNQMARLEKANNTSPFIDFQ